MVKAKTQANKKKKTQEETRLNDILEKIKKKKKQGDLSKEQEAEIAEKLKELKKKL